MTLVRCSDCEFKEIDISPLTKEQLDMIEADSFWCMSKLLDGIQDNYTFAQPGIQTKVAALKELTLRIDGTYTLRTLHVHVVYTPRTLYVLRLDVRCLKLKQIHRRIQPLIQTSTPCVINVF